MKYRLISPFAVLSLAFVYFSALGGAAAQTTQSVPANYFRLRLSFTTTSDTATLETYEPTILGARIVSVQGSPSYSLDGANVVNLGQPYYDALLGRAVGVDVDVIASSDILAHPPTFDLRTGSLHGGTISIYNVAANGQTQFLQRVVGGGQTFFTLDASALKSAAPLRTPAQQTSISRKAFAFYYPWYTSSSWSVSTLKDKPVTPYSSDDTNVIAAQIDEAKSAGLDGFISSWWGPGSYEDGNFKKLLAAAQGKPFSAAIYLETLNNNQARDAGQLFDWLSYALSNYGGDSAMLKLNGKPVVFIYAADSASVATWQSIFSKLRAQGLDAQFIALGDDPAKLNTFDGLHQYGYTASDFVDLLPGIGANTRYYDLLADAPTARKLWSPSVAPGYDERLLSGAGRTGRYFDRANGAYFQSQFDAALQSSPDWLLITSWNEYYENTHIEPSALYGDKYLTLTRQRIGAWKAATANAIQFGSASYTASESDPFALVTVTRAGDLSHPASVEYATADGTARQTKDYTAVAGVLSFAAGESSKTFAVPLTQNGFADGAHTVNPFLANASGAILQTPNAATLTIKDDDAANASANPIDDPTQFVRQQYHDFLSREPDAAGLAFWANQSAACKSDARCIDAQRTSVSAAFFLSTEFQQTGFLVYLADKAAYKAMPKYADFVADSARISQGVVVGATNWQQQLETNKQSFFDSFVNRAAFRLLYDYMPNDQFVDALISNTGATFNQTDRNQYIAGLDGGTLTHAQILRKISEYPAFSQKEFGRAFVLMQYFGYLRRNPDDPPDGNLNGYNFWLLKLNSYGGDYIKSEMVKSFILSQEYRQRFGKP